MNTREAAVRRGVVILAGADTGLEGTDVRSVRSYPGQGDPVKSDKLVRRQYEGSKNLIQVFA
jgi:hypothetical protein